MDLPAKYNNEGIETWGKGKRFGFVKISKTNVYWFAVMNSKNLKTREVDLVETFKEFHKDILTKFTEKKQMDMIFELDGKDI